MIKEHRMVIIPYYIKNGEVQIFITPKNLFANNRKWPEIIVKKRS